MTSFPVRTFPSHSSFLITEASNQVFVGSNYGIYMIPALFFLQHQQCQPDTYYLFAVPKKFKLQHQIRVS